MSTAEDWTPAPCSTVGLVLGGSQTPPNLPWRSFQRNLILEGVWCLIKYQLLKNITVCMEFPFQLIFAKYSLYSDIQYWLPKQACVLSYQGVLLLLDHTMLSYKFCFSGHITQHHAATILEDTGSDDILCIDNCNVQFIYNWLFDHNVILRHTETTPKQIETTPNLSYSMWSTHSCWKYHRYFSVSKWCLPTWNV